MSVTQIYILEVASVDVAAKHPEILAELRRRVIAGEYAPGSQFPTHDDLEKIFGASRVTVQKALNRLASDGYIFTKGRRGTFVAEFPPHLFHYGMVFPTRPSSNGWVRFWTALANEAERIHSAQPRKMFCYNGIDGHTDNIDFQNLLLAVKRQQLAGLIFTFPPSRELLAAILREQPDLPVVALTTGAEAHRYAVVDLDVIAFVDRALDFLHAQKRTRIAMMTVPWHAPAYHAHFAAGLAARGMTSKPFWTQEIPPFVPSCAKNCAHLLLNAEQRTRPDGLIITDDNLVEYATSGLIAAGVSVPEDLSVVAHCNFPWPTPSVLPARRLGFDARQVLQACIETIDEKRRGEKSAAMKCVLPVFEDEIASV